MGEPFLFGLSLHLVPVQGLAYTRPSMSAIEL